MESKLISAGEFLDLFDEDDCPPAGAEVVEDGEWTVEFKDYATRVITYKFGEQFFAVSESRSGNYYSDYFYDDPTCVEVVPEVVPTTIYVVKK